MLRVAIFALALAVAGVSGQWQNVVTTAKDEYDFVVVGGGLAGLVMGNRLSANGKYTVLVLEAGSTGADYADSINVPALAYYGQLWSLPVNWGYYITPQSGLDGDTMEWPRGKVLGGSSAINGMYITHPSSTELDVWADMIKGLDGADNWNWDSFYAAMKKSENMNKPDAAILQQGNIEYVASSRGEGGPIQMTYPGIAFGVNGDWTTAATTKGLTFTKDAYGGDNFGSFIATSCINPGNWTRSYSASGYLWPLPPMDNYDVLANAFVNKIVFDTSGSNLVANGVEYVVNDQTYTVKVSKEVIVSAGSVNTPTVLQHSGVGPPDVLNKAGVKVLNPLPGVGAHLMDHLSIQIGWKSSEETAGQMYQNGDNSAVLLGYVDDAVGYADAKLLGVSGLESSILSNAKSPFTDSTVTAGYEAIVKATASTILSSNSGQVEILLGNDLENGTCRLQVCLQHPYSQGSVTISSSNPQSSPVINPNYLSHPADLEILVAGLKLARSIGESAPLSGVLTEYFPGPSVQSDAEWEAFIRGNADTEFHPSSTSAMLPLDQGGVVDGNLLVYGTTNVRVADASVPPIEFSSHLMSTTYGIAERASEIILDYWESGGSSKAQSNSVDSKTVKSKSSSGKSSSSSDSSGAAGVFATSPVVVLATAFAGILLAFTFA